MRCNHSALVRRLVWTLAVAAGVGSTLALAEDVEKKWRVGAQIGDYSTVDEVVSDSANQMAILEPPDDTLFLLLLDPRNDSAALGNLEIKPAPRIMATAQYGLTKTVLIELAAGYQKGDIGDIEVQAQFDRVTIPVNQDYVFAIDRVNAGEVEQVPLQLSILGRFRPRARFNPYVGGGIGYTFVGYQPSSDMNSLSVDLDRSVGQFANVSTLGGFDISGDPENLEGAEVLAPDYLEWHAMGGAEYGIGKRWTVYADVRYQWASRNLQVRFGDRDQVGSSVPNLTLDRDDPRANPALYGAYFIQEGGLFDGGSIVPLSTAGDIPQDEWDTFCASTPDQCEFSFDYPDGENDPGFYYVKGGTLEYGGWSWSVGFRYTF